jgi:hypothetical protein
VRARAQFFAHLLEDHVERRDGENAEERREDHAAKHRRSDIAPRQILAVARFASSVMIAPLACWFAACAWSRAATVPAFFSTKSWAR